MPAWSPKIADAFIGLAARDLRGLNQSQLQKLVYIAHGWSLALFDRALTGDRPEAWHFGPVYRRLADALAPFGREPVLRTICGGTDKDRSELDVSEQDVIAMVYQNYGRLEASRLSTWTRKNGSPWAQVFANGSGEFRDISHQLIKAQFVELAKAARVPQSGA